MQSERALSIAYEAMEERMLTMTELGDREFYAAMAMQGIISREKLPADEVARSCRTFLGPD